LKELAIFIHQIGFAVVPPLFHQSRATEDLQAMTKSFSLLLELNLKPFNLAAQRTTD
jgi:hypothetical protein